MADARESIAAGLDLIGPVLILVAFSTAVMLFFALILQRRSDSVKRNVVAEELGLYSIGRAAFGPGLDINPDAFGLRRRKRIGHGGTR